MKTFWYLSLIATTVCCIDYIDAHVVPDGYEETEVDVLAEWRPVFVYENRKDIAVEQKITTTKGMKDLTSDKRILSATHSVGAALAAGDPYQILSLSVSYSFSQQQCEVTMTQTEIYASQVIEHTVTIPRNSKFTRWELNAEVAGSIIQYIYLIDVLDDIQGVQRIPQVMRSRAKILVRRQIHFGTTVIRIKHFGTKQYMTVVDRHNWPAATLGHSNLYEFVLCEDSRGIRIKTLNSVHPGYVWAYSSRNGGVYFDWNRDIVHSYDSNVNAQHWSISKAMPLYHGDIVSFRNKFYGNSGMCYHDGPETNIYCLATHEDRWVLEVESEQSPDWGRRVCI